MIKVHPKYDGQPCGEITETAACNMQACDQDCELKEWTEWSKCSKACGKGNKKRRRFVQTPAVGAGKCPSKRSRKRFQFARCNNGPCDMQKGKPLKCKSKVDVSLVLDASGTVGPAGWDETKKFVKFLSTAFEGEGTDAQLSFIAFSGPTEVDKLDACAGRGEGQVDMDAVCKIKMVAPFGETVQAATSSLDGVSFMAGTRLLSAAMEMSKSELTLARRSATKVVVIITGSRPTELAATYRAARSLRRAADKVMFAAVNSDEQALREFASWGSKPANENVLSFGSFGGLNSLDTANNLVSSICDQVSKA